MTERPASFDAEVIECRFALKAFAKSLVRDEARAEDVVSSTIVRSLEKWEQFQPGTNLKGWLFTILRNIVYSNGRKAKFQCEDPDDVLALRMTTPPAQLPTIELKETMARMRDLSRSQRKMLMMIVDRYSYEEIAEVMHLPIGTVKSSVSRSRAYLENGTSDVLEQVAEPEAELRVSESDVIRLFKLGMSVSDICEKLKADRSEVRSIVMTKSRTRVPDAV